jgi:hypothetical protein
MREAYMEIALLLRSIILLLVLGLTAGSVPAQETMRVAIPLFPIGGVSVLWPVTRGCFRKRA